MGSNVPRRGIILIVMLLLATSQCAVAPKHKAEEPTAAKPAAAKAQPSSTPRPSVAPADGRTGWLEMPSSTMPDAACKVYEHSATISGRPVRNYTCLYDKSMYASYWVAYPLSAEYLGTGREESWSYDSSAPQSDQTKVATGYGAKEPTANYAGNYYARGHQIPNADRNGVDEMMAQTYYSTNMTPQLQNGFNGAIWAKLEEAVRNAVPQGDTIYVVTGATFRKTGDTTTTIKQITNRNDGKTLPVPNWYWKAILKVHRDAGRITSADAVGFWLPHDDLKGHDWSEYTVSVDEIEKWTGFDLFVNLDDALEDKAEANPSWTDFLSFR